MAPDDVSASVRLMTAIETTWSGIRRRHPAVPEVIATIGSGTRGRRTETLGHFAAGRWERAAGRMPELFIGGEGLRHGARETLDTLIHEAAHGAAHTRGIRDTSRQGRYHNQAFRAVAEEMGLRVARDPAIGWSLTTVPDATAADYTPELAALTDALTVYRRPDPTRGGRTSSNGTSLRCTCGRRIRVSPTVAAAGPILCGVCRKPFTPQV